MARDAVLHSRYISDVLNYIGDDLVIYKYDTLLFSL